MSADKKIITDRPGLTGFLKGFKAAEEGSRTTDADSIPEGQRDEYMQGFKRGAKSALNNEDS